MASSSAEPTYCATCKMSYKNAPKGKQLWDWRTRKEDHMTIWYCVCIDCVEKEKPQKIGA